MATLTFSTDTYVAPAARAVATRPAGSGFFARLVAAMMESRERQARREINRMLSMTGDPAVLRDATRAGNLPF